MGVDCVLPRGACLYDGNGNTRIRQKEQDSSFHLAIHTALRGPSCILPALTTYTYTYIYNMYAYIYIYVRISLHI